jgi:hypothetical protein
MIVWLASYPRSGNTFSRLVMNRMYGVPLPDIYSHEPRADTPEAYTAKAAYPEFSNNISLDEARAVQEIMAVKTHELPSDDSPAIYIVRDGRDALVSHAHFVLQCDKRYLQYDLADFEQVLRQRIEYDDSFGGWSRHITEWHARRAGTAIVRFEELIASPATVLRAAVADLGLSLVERPDVVIPSFFELHDLAPPFFRRGVVGSWRDEMPDDLHERFWQRHGAAMQVAGYARNGRVPQKLKSGYEASR